MGTTLHDKDILVAHRSLDLDTRLSVGELPKLDLVGFSAELLADGIGQGWMAEAAKDTSATHLDCRRSKLLLFVGARAEQHGRLTFGVDGLSD